VRSLRRIVFFDLVQEAIDYLLLHGVCVHPDARSRRWKLAYIGTRNSLGNHRSHRL
jgi:hypothetical protein